MQYTITINQKALAENFPDLDIIDGAIYDFIRKYMASENIHRLHVEDQVWYWISYKKIADELPILSVKTKDAIYRRVKKLADCGILEFKSDNDKLNRSYFRQGKYFDTLTFNTTPGSKSEPSDTNPNPRIKNRNTPGSKSDPPSDTNPTDHNTKDHNTTDKKESVSTDVPDSIKSIAHLLRDRICEWDEDHLYTKKDPAFEGKQGWYNEIEKAVRIDGRTEEQLKFLIDYIFTKNTRVANMWKPNIQSGKKLREKFDQVKGMIKVEYQKMKGGNNGGGKSKGEQAVQISQQILSGSYKK